MKKLIQLLTILAVVLVLGVFARGTLPSSQAAPLLGRTSVNGVWGLSPETLTITGTQTLTPTRSMYLLAPSTPLTLTLSTGGAVAGDKLVFISTVATNTVFADTGALQGGTKTFDEDADRISFEFDGSEWVLDSFIDQSNSVSGGAGSFSSLTTTGNADVGGTLQYGSDNNYPLGMSASGNEIVCGTTGVFTGSTTIDATALTTATYALATQTTAQTTTAAYLHVTDPTTTTVTLTSLNSSFGAGTTGVSVHYCIVGNQ